MLRNHFQAYIVYRSMLNKKSENVICLCTHNHDQSVNCDNEAVVILKYSITFQIL